MNLVTTVSAVVAMLGSALIGGVFYAFSSFIMKALARVPSEEGIAAMQSINIVVINPSFLAGALLYIFGTILVTGLGNVPLNDRWLQFQLPILLPLQYGSTTWTGGRC